MDNGYNIDAVMGDNAFIKICSELLGLSGSSFYQCSSLNTSLSQCSNENNFFKQIFLLSIYPVIDLVLGCELLLAAVASVVVL